VAPRRLRIAFLVDGFAVGGTELNAVRTAEAIDRSRYDLTVLGMRRDGPLLERYRAAGVRVEDFAFRGLRHPDAVTMVPRHVRWLRAHGIDVLHAHDKYSNMYGALIGRLARVPLLIASRRFENHGARRFAVGNRVAYHLADRALANSDGVGALLVREGIPPAKVAVVPNFLDDAAFEPAPPAARAAFAAELALPADAIVVGCVARLVPVKDHPTLLRAFADVARAEPRAVLVLVGDGPSRAALEALAGELGVAHAVRFAGQRENAVNLHQSFDVSTLSSVSEGFPNTVIEALAAAVPVVATDVGAVRDAVVDGRTGLVVPAGDSAAFGRALLALVRDPARRAALGAEGRRLALARYRREAVLAQLYALWEGARRAAPAPAGAEVPAPVSSPQR
jgi:glycosyltransferase involved in cell wall biosynthesis